MRCRLQEGAFTIIELVIVMMIVGVLTAFVAPHLGRGFTTSIDIAARDIASELQLGKMRAVSQNTKYQISFNTENNTYQVQKDVAGEWQNVCPCTRPPCPTPLPPCPTPLPPGVGFDKNESVKNPVFQTLGTAPGGGSITLKNVRGYTRKITVSFAGRVHVEKVE